MKKRYIVIYSNNLPDDRKNLRSNFIYIIEGMINDKWKLEGGVSITWNDQISEIVYAQALSKES